MNKTLYFTHKKLEYLELRYSNKEHIHNSLSIGAILNGKRTYINKNKSFRLSKNQISIINPNTIHSCNSNNKIANKL
jgi:quercetin dioxygenase-like cupin family protein